MVMVAAAFMDLLDGTIVQVALPSLQRGLRVDDAVLQWTVSAYTLAFALLLITGARLGDMIGQRRCFLAGLVGFVAASAAVAAAQSGTVLIAFRAVQGAAAASMLPQVLTFIQTEFDPDHRPKAFAIYGMILALAGASGPLLGGVLIHASIAGLGWRAIFLVNVPVGAVAFLLGLRLIPPSAPVRTRRLDPIGALVLSAALLALFYPLIEGRQLGWPTWAFVSLAASIPLLGVFVGIEARLSRHGGVPLLELGVLRVRDTAIGLLVALLFFGATSLFFVLTLLLQLGLKFSALKTGISFMPFSVGIVFGSAAAAPLGQRYGRTALTAGTLVMTATLVSVIYLLGREGSRLAAWQPAPSLAIAGLAFGIVSGTLADTVLAPVAPELSTSASGIVNTIIQLASVLAVAVAGAIFFGALGHRPEPHTYLFAARDALWYLTASTAAATAATRLIPGTRKRRLRATDTPGARPGIQSITTGPETTSSAADRSHHAVHREEA